MFRRFLLTLLIGTSLAAVAQPVSCDLSLSDNTLVNASGGDLDANNLVVGQTIRVKVFIGNFISGVTAPGGHFRLRIGLGNGLILQPGYDLSTAPLSDKFNWSYDLSGAQPQIVGNSRSNAPLPDGFGDYANFPLKAVNSTTSTVSFNLLIANPPGGTTTPMSDPNSQNNSGLNIYTISAAGPLPVTIVGFNAVRKDCNVKLAWKTETQVDVEKYEVEVSKDNLTFAKHGELPARPEGVYAYDFPITEAVKAPAIFVRLKTVDLDGTFKYSKTVSVPGLCNAKWVLSLFPNPLRDASVLTVQAREGMFDGTYKVSVFTASGQLVQQRQLTLNGAKSFPLPVQGIAAGHYRVQVESADGTGRDVLEFEKL